MSVKGAKASMVIIDEAANVSRETFGHPDLSISEWIGTMRIPYSHMLTSQPGWDRGALENEEGTAIMGGMVLMKCVCGRIGSLYEHHVDADGTVVPSVVCMNDDCDFHKNVILEDYPDGGKESGPAATG